VLYSCLWPSLSFPCLWRRRADAYWRRQRRQHQDAHPMAYKGTPPATMRLLPLPPPPPCSLLCLRPTLPAPPLPAHLPLPPFPHLTRLWRAWHGFPHPYLGRCRRTRHERAKRSQHARITFYVSSDLPGRAHHTTPAPRTAHHTAYAHTLPCLAAHLHLCPLVLPRAPRAAGRARRFTVVGVGHRSSIVYRLAFATATNRISPT